MALPTDKLYVPASAAEIRDDFLTDVRLEGRKYADETEVDRITRPGTDWFILATAVGNLGILQYSNIAKADANSNVLTATGENLDAIRQALGLPEVNPAPAKGNIVVTTQPASATANFSSNELILPNGKRAKVDGVHLNVANQDEIPIITIDTGFDTNFSAGTVVRFVSPPINAKTEAKVSTNIPFSGGTSEETDERKRDRILNRLRNAPAGGNWGYAIETALNALATVQYAFAYPALGGPGSAKLVLVKDIDPDQFDFSRTLSAQSTAFVRDALHANMPDEMELVVSSVTEQQTDVILTMSLPNAVSAGGNGLGWLDANPWPTYSAFPPPSVGSVNSDGKIVWIQNVNILAPPVPGQTHIAWWSKTDQQFHVRLITGYAILFGDLYVTLDEPLVDSASGATAQIGEYISPASVYVTDYGKTWQTSLRRLGPGENTTDVNRLPRSLRRPFIADAWYSSLSAKQLTEMQNAHPEINDIAWAYRSVTTPTVPGSVATAPNILVPGNFGIYKP